MLVGRAAGETAVVVPLYEGRVPLPEEQTVLYLRVLLGQEIDTPAYRSGNCTQVAGDTIAINYRGFQEALERGAPHAPRTVVPLHFLYLEIEVCLIFMVEALNCHVQEYSQSRVLDLNGTGELAGALRFTSWTVANLREHWGMLSGALGRLAFIECGGATTGWLSLCSTL